MEPVKLFISYSWSNQDHIAWVITLATELRESGIDVILDKWDLKEGHDSVAFMEKMVTDSNITKVLIISDRVYADKANGRSGGVGTETQIISKEVYDNVSQNKFALVITDRDEENKPYLPAYYKSRIFIDFSEPEKYTDSFEQLVRWVYDKPIYEKPALGKRPSFLDESDSVSLGTSIAFRRVITGIKEGRSNASGALAEYFALISTNFKTFRIENNEGEYDDKFIENVEQFTPYRDELTQVFQVICQYAATDINIDHVHKLFESLMPYMDRIEGEPYGRDYDYDNSKFIIHELFLYWIAIMLKHELFHLVNIFLNKSYYNDNDRHNDPVKQYFAFWNYLDSLEIRNKRLSLNLLSLHSTIIKERAEHSGISFRYLMQADFVLYLRFHVKHFNQWDGWWPDTLIYSEYIRFPFEIFAKAESKDYFNKMKSILGINTKSQLGDIFEEFDSGKRHKPLWRFRTIDFKTLSGYNKLDTTS